MRLWNRHGWIIRRLGVAVLSLWVVSVVVFMATQALPGDAAVAILGRQATPEAVSIMRADLGLNRPLVTQYVDWFGDVLVGDFGESVGSGAPISDLIGSRIVNTAVLLVVSAVIIFPAGIALGVFAALRRDGPLDRVFSVTTPAMNALPAFVVGLVLVILFGTTVWKIFPATALFPPGDFPLRHPDVMVLPVATLVLSTVPYLALIVRATTIEALESDYVQMARLKGLRPRTVVLVHALPNVVVPILQTGAVILGHLAGGVVVVEFLFRYPGLGTSLTNAVSARDLALIQASTLLLAAAIVIINLIADILTVQLTPRLRTAET